MIWTEQARMKVADGLLADMSAGEIGKQMGVTRNSVIGIVMRDERLAKIGFARSPNSARSRKTKAQLEDMRKAAPPKRGWQRTNIKATEVFHGERPGAEAYRRHWEPPRLSVVSNNVSLMVQDWLAKNGGARKFEDGATTDYWRVRSYLEDRGYKLSLHGSRHFLSTGRRQRSVTFKEILGLADQHRRQEGLEPFLAA